MVNAIYKLKVGARVKKTAITTLLLLCLMPHSTVYGEMLNSNTYEITIKNPLVIDKTENVEPPVEPPTLTPTETPIAIPAEPLVEIVSEETKLELAKLTDARRVEKIAKINKAIAKYGKGVAVYYKNIDANYTYKYNEDEVFNAASVIKAPYCLYVYETAQKNKLDLTKVHVYTKNVYRGGTGVIQKMPVGTKFTENELLKHAIRSSDNIAFRMLINQFGTNEFKDFIKDNGLDNSKIRTITGAKVNAKDVMGYANMIYEFISKDGLLEKQFKTDLMSTDTPMIVSKYPIARKYGWWEQSFHDMAIVYSTSPYILVILTDRDDGKPKDLAIFTQISKLIEEFNESEFVSQP